ncbi:three component ABC system middle component [Variovorax sp. 770b2]|uniref:three component ABC system middle component n=1 Tax=Variovorax sp. 770b2 TaxID=1566271 RepID=UPI0008E8509C|nr:three component ABC system middle component [Variovorax sp. 770b2]SFQ23835.1 hypothetical protein SAMN03159339_6194 [Variovorax sp. 770b2]
MPRTNLRPLSETALIQNPALGAFALWNFGISYQAERAERPSLPLAFIVLPLVLHQETRELIGSTLKASGLALFAEKLGEQRENLLAVHNRALHLRTLTLNSIAVGASTRLLTINYETAKLRANSLEGRSLKPKLPERIKWIGAATEKLGHWFSIIPDQQIARTLRIDF